MLTEIDVDEEELAAPEEGETESHPGPPDSVEVDTLKFKLPVPELRTLMDWDKGVPPPATV
jgi:hypothetical protein